MKEDYKITLRQNWPAGFDEVRDKNSYIYDRICRNCHISIRFIIKKGESTRIVYGTAICPNCGCIIIGEKT